MREIKIRGYSTEKLCADSQWVEGTGVHTTKFTNEFAEKVGKAGETFIFTESGWFEVYPESVGQNTGLKDKNGVEIYEGDIVKHEDLSIGCTVDLFVTGEVKMLEGAWTVDDGKKAEWLWSETAKNEILGNIYENPELLEVEANA